MLSKWLVEFAFFLNASTRYRHSKRFFYNLLENANYPYKKFFDFTMILMIAISVYILIRHVKHEVSPAWLFFNNYIISMFFLCEYLIRLWIYSSVSKIIIEQYEYDLYLQRQFDFLGAFKKIVSIKLGFIFSPAAIIDLLAIMPFFHELRMLRIFIIFRVFKLFRYTKSLRQLLSILASKKFEILTLAMFAAVMIMVSSVLIYVMEANNPESKINTLFDAVYWSVVTIFTVGYGDFVPVTHEGRIVAMLIIIAGIAVISFATSIVVSAFTEKLDSIKEEKLIDDVSKMKIFYLICGYSPLAHEVASRLTRNKSSVVILEKDRKKVVEAQKEGLIALTLDSALLHTYHTMHIDFNTQVTSVILLHESDVLNVYTALTIRELSKSIPMLSVLEKSENRRKLSLAGINEIVYTQELIGLMSKEISGKPVAFEVIHALRSENSGVIIEEIILDASMAGHFFEVESRDIFKKRLIVLGLYRGDIKKFLFNPDTRMIVDEGDIAIVIGSRSLIDEFKALLHKKVKR
ncbi:MAG: ion transporter [Sulfuricurvum sp.]|jgi:voltage-gated potassium channel